MGYDNYDERIGNIERSHRGHISTTVCTGRRLDRIICKIERYLKCGDVTPMMTMFVGEVAAGLGPLRDLMTPAPGASDLTPEAVRRVAQAVGGLVERSANERQP